jgi:hypothetical protein
MSAAVTHGRTADGGQRQGHDRGGSVAGLVKVVAGHRERYKRREEAASRIPAATSTTR